MKTFIIIKIKWTFVGWSDQWIFFGNILPSAKYSYFEKYQIYIFFEKQMKIVILWLLFHEQKKNHSPIAHLAQFIMAGPPFGKQSMLQNNISNVDIRHTFIFRPYH